MFSWVSRTPAYLGTDYRLAGLEAAAPVLTGQVRRYCSRARQRAVRYLERALPSTSHPHTLALAALSLARAGAHQATTTQTILSHMIHKHKYLRPGVGVSDAGGRCLRSADGGQAGGGRHCVLVPHQDPPQQGLF